MDTNDVDREHFLYCLQEEYACFDILGVYDNAEDFIHAGILDELDVLFINFYFENDGNGSDGTYLQHYVHNNNPRCLCVFLSKDKADAYKVFAYGGFDFIPKPFQIDECERVLNKIFTHFNEAGFFQENQKHIFMAKTRAGYQIIHTEKIVYIELVDRLCYFYMDDGRTVSLSGYTMRRIEQIFAQYGFFRCHQSLLVNLSKINSIIVNNQKKWYSLDIDGYETTIPLSREKYDELLDRLNGQYTKLPN